MCGSKHDHLQLSFTLSHLDQRFSVIVHVFDRNLASLLAGFGLLARFQKSAWKPTDLPLDPKGTYRQDRGHQVIVDFVKGEES